jgi:hypothetical protein
VPSLAPDRGRMGIGSPQLPSLDLATVGYTDPVSGEREATPAWVRLEQGEVLVEITTANGDEIVARIGSGVHYLALEYGCQVVVAYPDGDETLATIVARCADMARPIPSSVAGVSTGAAGATEKGVHVPAMAWTFTRLPDGQLLAIETGSSGDILVHGGASIEIRAAGSIHLNGRVALGAGPTAAPTGAVVSAAGETLPGVPMVPAIDPAFVSAPVPPNTIVPYSGTEHGILRAKDDLHSHIGIDPGFWTWAAGVDAVARGINNALPPLPVVLHSQASGYSGPGCPHTAGDEG